VREADGYRSVKAVQAIMEPMGEAIYLYGRESLMATDGVEHA
jgi:hypothetical protein